LTVFSLLILEVMGMSIKSSLIKSVL